mgnify:FL=1
MNNFSALLTHAQTSRYRALKEARARRQEGLFLLEGVRLCEEAFNSRLEISACITTKTFDKLAIPPNLQHFQASPTQLEQISDSKHPQGIICVARIPKLAETPTPAGNKLLLVMDRLSDPGNMGTIFRSALWFGVEDILLGPDCVDPYGPKAVRSSMGAIGTLNLHFSNDLIASAIEWKRADGDVAALHMTGTSLSKYKAQSGLFLIVGSEAHGVAPDLLELSVALSIEKYGKGESLNAGTATAIALYELTRS